MLVIMQTLDADRQSRVQANTDSSILPIHIVHD